MSKKKTPSSEVPDYLRDDTKWVLTDKVAFAKTHTYSSFLWKGVVPTYKCNTCGLFLASKDDMILHVVKHYPETEQNQALEQLIKEK